MGAFSPLFGVRSGRCPPWITSQQQAELFGVLFAARLAMYRCWPAASIISDNTAAVGVIANFRAASAMWGAPGTLVNACLHVRIAWMPGSLMPADFPSRLFRYTPHPTPLVAAAHDAWRQWAQLCSVPLPISFAPPLGAAGLASRPGRGRGRPGCPRVTTWPRPGRPEDQNSGPPAARASSAAPPPRSPELP